MHAGEVIQDVGIVRCHLLGVLEGRQGLGISPTGELYLAQPFQELQVLGRIDQASLDLVERRVVVLCLVINEGS